MVILSGKDIKISFGERTLFQNVSFSVDENDKIGLVGINGAGKTTLFKLLSGNEPEDWEGRLDKFKGFRAGFMEQHLLRDEEVTIYEEALSVFSPLIKMEQELEEIHQSIDQGEQSNTMLERQMSLTERFQQEGGLTFRARTKSMLTGMGFSETQQGKKVKVLSGGERSKLQLIKLLLSGANLLLLDEPTNHLDIEAAEWLEKFLQDFKGAYIVISHDRYFLDHVTNKIFALDNGTLDTYKGNYTDYLRQYDQRVEFLTKQYNEMTGEIARIEGIIEQQKRFNQEHNYITIASKQKQIDRIKAQLVPPPPARKKIRFSFPCTLAHGTDALWGENLSLTINRKNLFQNISFDIKYGEKVFMMGANGVGKSSLIKILMGKNHQDSGKFFIADWLKIGYFDQLQELRLTSTKTALDFIWDDYPKLNRTQVRSALAMFGMNGEEAGMKVNALSGGEAAKLVLIKIMLAGPNLLIFDEPTNHLDLEAREALAEALEGYQGTMLIISHDRALIDRVATRLLMLYPDRMDSFEGNYSKYRESRQYDNVPETKAPGEKRGKSTQNLYTLRKESESRLRKAKTRMERAEAEMDRLKEESEELNREMGEKSNDFQFLEKASERLSQIDARQEELLLEWEAAEKEAAKLEEKLKRMGI